MVILKTDDGIDICVLPESATCELAGENPLDMRDLPEGCPEKKCYWDFVCRPAYCPYYSE